MYILCIKPEFTGEFVLSLVLFILFKVDEYTAWQNIDFLRIFYAISVSHRTRVQGAST